MDELLIERNGAGGCHDRQVRAPRPDSIRCVTWPGGPDVRPEDLEALAAEPLCTQDSDVVEWIHRCRATDPTQTLVVLEERTGDVGTAVGWRRVGEVVAQLEDRMAGFIGDTTPTSLAGLREWTRHSLPDDVVSPQVRADIVLVVDELASNVEEHAPGWLTVDLVVADDHVLVVVSDAHPGRVPIPGEAPPDQAHGRGLFLVSVLSERWGIVSAPTTKAVWAEIARNVLPTPVASTTSMVENGDASVDTGRAADGAVV